MCLHVNYPLFLSVCNVSSFFATYFLNIKFHACPSPWEPSCSMRTDRPTDKTKLIVTFRGYVNAPKMFLIHEEMYISALFSFRDNAVSIATCYGMDGPGIESRWGQIFRTRPDRHWGPPSLLYKVRTGAFPRVKRPDRDADHPPHLALRLKIE
jgi:hypothetical protein